LVQLVGGTEEVIRYADAFSCARICLECRKHLWAILQSTFYGKFGGGPAVS
jgi:hypothetical protein